MARNDGIDRTSARNVNLTAAKIGNAQRHNEREKESYTNPDIIPERTSQNIHFKKPTAGYAEMFAQMEKDGVISTRGLKTDANLYGELIFDVNSAYFYNHGGYEFAKRFYEDAYRAAIEIVGGEQYILSAVMHADERNRAMSEALGQDVFHYHLHVVYVPVVEKQIRGEADPLVQEVQRQVSCGNNQGNHYAGEQQQKMDVQTGIGRTGSAYSPEEWQAGAAEILQRPPGRFLPSHAQCRIYGCGAWRTGQERAAGSFSGKED